MKNYKYVDASDLLPNSGSAKCHYLKVYYQVQQWKGETGHLNPKQEVDFISRVMKQYCEIVGIKQIRASPYHPQMDGMVEYLNSTLKKRLLRKLVQNTKVEWDQCLPYVLWACRGTVHKTTGFTPHELVFGKKMRMPLDCMVCYWQGIEETDPSNVAESP